MNTKPTLDWLASRGGSVFFRSKRNAEMQTSIAAEAKIEDPDLKASSGVPEVQARIDKIRRETK